MRLLQLVPLHDSYRVFLKEMAETLRADGHEVMTLCRIGEGNSVIYSEEKTDCRHFSLPRGGNPLKHWKSARALGKVVEAFKPDVVHAHFSSAILTAALARQGRGAGLRWIGTFQGLQFPHATGVRGQLLKRAEAYAARCMDEAIVLTSDDVEVLQAAATRARVRMQQSPGFGCKDRFLDTPLPDEFTRHAFRKQAGLSSDHVVMIFIGRLVAHKGFHVAARGFLEAYRHRPELRWLVIGELDPLHPSGLTEAEFKAFQSHEAISWLRTQEDVLPWLDAADAMLFPTTREGMPVSVMESIARRLPVLTNRVRGCRELIEQDLNGRFFQDPSREGVARELTAFQPFRPPEPPERIRRSHWIAEMRRLYAIQ